VLWRAADEEQIELGVFLQKRRHKKAAIFFQLFIEASSITTYHC